MVALCLTENDRYILRRFFVSTLLHRLCTDFLETSPHEPQLTPVALVTKFWHVATNVRLSVSVLLCSLQQRRATITLGFATLSSLLPALCNTVL